MARNLHKYRSAGRTTTEGVPDMKPRHYTAADFTVTATSPAYDGSATENRFGYCRKCFGDMQSFGGKNGPGPLKHYNSHETAIRLGLWGRRRTA